MRKLATYEAYHDGKLIGAHESWRVYSHAVIVQDDIKKHRARAYGYQPSKTDRSNFDYYTDVAAKPVGEPRGIFGHYTERDEGRLVHVSDDPRPEAGFFWAPLTTSPLAHRNGTQRVPFAYPAPRSTHTPCSGALPDLSFSL